MKTPLARMHLIRLFAVALALATPLSARADEADGTCDSPVVAGQDTSGLALARMLPSRPKASFVRSRGPGATSCPSPGERCKARAFLVANDEVIVQQGAGPFLCALYKSPKGAETTGWLATQDLAVAPRTAATGAAAWLGTWRRDSEGEIRIVRKDGALSVEGDATWGASDPERVRRGGVHIGQLEGPIKVIADTMAVGEGYDGTKPLSAMDSAGCFARLTLLGRYLVAEDNFGCGGMNVSFTGIYLRVAR